MAKLTQEKIYEALGVQPEGVQGQEPATPAAQNPQTDPAPAGDNAGQEGAQGQEPATPAVEDVNTESAAQTVPTAGLAAPEEPDNQTDPFAAGEGTQELTLQQRRENAARRRLQEQQAAVNAAVQQEREKNTAEMAEFFKLAGLKNSFTGEPITSLEQFYDWNKKFQEQKMQQDLKAGKLTPEVIQAAVSQHPAIKQAEEIVKQGQAAQQRASADAARARLDAQIAELGKKDPSIQSVQDLIAKPYYPQMYDYVKRGFTLSEAYLQVNHQQEMAATAERARQQAMNNSRGKDHLNAVGASAGTGALSVPADVKAMFLQFNPNATEAQIQAYYNDYKKGK